MANPERKKLNQKIRHLKNKLQELQAKYGDRARHNDERQRRTMRGFKIANGELSAQIQLIEKEIADFERCKAAVPASVAVKDVLDGETPKQVHQETRQILHGFRMVVFRTESALRELLRPHYRGLERAGSMNLHIPLDDQNLLSGDLSCRNRVKSHPHAQIRHIWTTVSSPLLDSALEPC